MRPNRRWRRTGVYAVIFLAVLGPTALLAWQSYRQLNEALTTMALQRRQALAHASALALEERLDALIDLGVSLATRVRIPPLVAEGKWDEAAHILDRVTDRFPYIERIGLFTLDGTLMASEPPNPENVGKNYAFRDWYRGVTGEWQPYLSDVFRRVSTPRFNTVAVAVPIRDHDNRVVGLMVMGVRLQHFIDWSRSIFTGSSGAIFAVDRSGQTVAQPALSPLEEIEDLSMNPVVRRALKGERGVTLYHNPAGGEERVAAFEPVPGYGWAAVVQQPAADVFALRDATLRGVLLIDSVILALILALAATITGMLRALLIARNDLAMHAEELAALNQEQEAFSYSVSHDLRAPLRAIDGASQTMVEDLGAQLGEPQRRVIAAIRGNVARMGQLVDDLLTFTRLTRLPLSRRHVNMDELVRRVASDVAAESEGRQIALDIEDLPSAQGDPALLRHVWSALISNALKFTRGRPAAEIKIGSLRAGRETVYFIRDNGVGFDMRYAGKLFGVFQRLHHPDEFEGTGVGLAIVQRIIHRHGGRIWAEAAIGQGATFFFTFETGIES